MQETSELWKKLIRHRNTQREFEFEINGIRYGSDTEVSHHVSGELFENFGVGNVCTAKLDAVFEIDEIPAKAEIKRYTRLAADKYAISGMVFWKQLEGWFSVRTPDNQIHYFLPNCIYGLEDSRVAVHYATLYWSVCEGLTGVSGGARTEDDGSLVRWESPVEFTQTAPEQYSDFLKLASWHLDGMEYSEWLPQGTFYTKRRSESDGLWSIEAYDALRGTGGKYIQEGEQEEWPQAADVVVARIAQRLGVSVDARTFINPEYMVEHPSDRTVAEVLSAIAAAHFGNFIMSDAGELRLVPLLCLPAETSYLVDQYGDPITLGGVRILV